jgi:WD40 repeat protein
VASLLKQVVFLAALCAVTGWSSGAYTPLAITDRSDYAFDKQGILYVSTTGGVIQRYDTHSGTYLTPFNVGGSLAGIDLSPDGTMLAVADSSTQGSQNRILLVNTTSGAATPVSFIRESLESGTFMVAWGSDGQLLVDSNFAGSGWVPLRRYNPATNTTVTVASVRQTSMLTPSADRNTIAIAEANISSGPITDYDVPSQAYHGSVGTNWFTFEVAVNRDGSKYVVPTYDGAFVYNKSGTTFTQQTILGQYASNGPLAAVFSPSGNYLFTSEWAWSGNEHGVRVYDAATMSLLQTIDPYSFAWNGNWAMGSGRMEISPDGRFLAVSVDNGVRLYDVSAFAPEPGIGVIALPLGFLVLRRIRKTRILD